MKIEEFLAAVDKFNGIASKHAIPGDLRPAALFLWFALKDNNNGQVTSSAIDECYDMLSSKLSAIERQLAQLNVFFGYLKGIIEKEQEAGTQQSGEGVASCPKNCTNHNH